MGRWMLLFLALVAVAAVGARENLRRPATASAPLAYDSREFAALVAESYQHAGAAGLAPFTEWFERAYAAAEGGRSLRGALQQTRARIAAARTAEERVERELEAARWLHGVVKATLPRFNVDRGHEFANAVRYGERQCFLQSVLLASLLQAVGVAGGVFMVWRNPQGQESNNGHATAVAALASGAHVLVDASYREPFVSHGGVFAQTPEGYRFLEPVYATGGRIVAYRAGWRRWDPQAVGGLDTAFLRSQFHYYRGERAPGGPLDRRPTAEGLAQAARYLQRAEQVAPGNVLAVYVLGNVYRRQGRLAEARQQYVRAHGLYRAYGYLPAGPAQAYRWAAGR